MYRNTIVIPYRDRQKHLEYFVANTVPLIELYLPRTKIVVVEQDEGKLFNRGALMNVAFNEYGDKTEYFFTHDVDLNPTRKFIEEYYTKEVDCDHVLGIYTSKCNTLGGIIKLTAKAVKKINGFPNNVWGWGSEDKALQNRTEFYDINKITSLTNESEHLDYLIRFDDVNDRDTTNTSKNTKKHYIDFNRLSRDLKKKEIMSSGLNNIEYHIVQKKIMHDIVDIVTVRL